MRTALVGGTRWSAGAGRVPNGVVVVDDDRIVDIDGPVSAVDRVIDLSGRFLLPGFVDAHVHPVTGGMRRITCDVTELRSREEAELRIAEAAASLAEGAWLVGGGWAYEWYVRGCPDAERLDRLAPGRPAVLKVRDGHSSWANSRALELAAVDERTPDPFDGRIERRADGRPQGTLHEGAMRLVERHVPAPGSGDIDRALAAGTAYLHSKGVTGWQDAWVTDVEHAAYHRRRGHAPRVVGALWWDRTRGVEQIEEIIDRTHDGWGAYRPSAVKLMLDGVCENFTAALLDPYVGPHGRGDGHAGIEFIPPQVVSEAVTAFDAAGVQCHFHAIGDRAVRAALDGVAAARSANGWSGPVHHVAHLQVVAPDDIPRFAALRVATTCQTVWACNEPAMTELTVPFLGSDRAVRQYPFASFLRSGARLAMGSDWPVSTGDVMEQISVAMRRRPPGDDGPPILVPGERMTLDEALTGWTVGSALVNGTLGDRGRIRVGNVADLTVFEEDPFTVSDPAEVAAGVTMVAGHIVFDREEGL